MNLSIVCSVMLFALASAFHSSLFRTNKMMRHSLKSTAMAVDGVILHSKPSLLHNIVLIKNRFKSLTTPSGIVFADSARARPKEGIAVDVGPGKIDPDTGVRYDMQVKQGDQLLFHPHDGIEVVINGTEHQFMPEDRVILKYAGDKLTIDSCDVIHDSVLIDGTHKPDTPIVVQSEMPVVPAIGTVVKVGPGKQAKNGNYIPMEVKVGDVVRYSQHLSNTIKIDGKDYYFAKMGHMLAKF